MLRFCRGVLCIYMYFVMCIAGYPMRLMGTIWSRLLNGIDELVWGCMLRLRPLTNCHCLGFTAGRCRCWIGFCRGFASSPVAVSPASVVPVAKSAVHPSGSSSVAQKARETNLRFCVAPSCSSSKGNSGGSRKRGPQN